MSVAQRSTDQEKAADALREREFHFTNDDFRFLSRLASEKTGIQLSEQKRDMVYSRLSRRLRALKLASFADYCQLIESPEGAEEISHLVNAITTNLTHFFREKHHFDHLAEHLLKPRLASNARRLRIWSAGCSSGMEPYSIAMVLESLLGGASVDARILATDIDTKMLDRGRDGHYNLDEYHNIPTEYRKWIKTDNERMQMDARLRQRITFNYLNLMEGWPMQGPFDAIFCRNVVIYFDKPTQAELFARMADLLSDDGFLYIGHSENITRVCDRFQLIGRTTYRKAV